MLSLVRRGFQKLATFSGRDTRAEFWPYAGFVLFAVFFVGFALMLPIFFESFARIGRFAAEHPELTTVRSAPGSYSIHIRGRHPELLPDIGAIVGVGALTVSAMVVLLAAATTRRLRDRGKSVLWALAPLPFLTYSFVMFPSLFTRIAQGDQDVLGQFFTVFSSNLLYMISVVWLCFLLIGQSAPNSDGASSKLVNDAAQ